MDAVQRANSGHPGMPMGMADIAQVLWRRLPQHNPRQPAVARPRPLRAVQRPRLDAAVFAAVPDRVPADDRGASRTSASSAARPPGHPEHDPALGIETTTGPLGQGLANAVGMALAEKMLAAQFNRDGLAIVDHHTYAFCGRRLPDGGRVARGLLVRRHARPGQAHRLLRRQRHLDRRQGGRAGLPTTPPQRFAAYGWHVVPDVDGHDAAAVERALRAARAKTARPSLICCKTIIGCGAPDKQGTKAAHGEALGTEEVAAARKTLGWPYPPFEVPEDDARRVGSPQAGRAARAGVARSVRALSRGTPGPGRANSSGAPRGSAAELGRHRRRRRSRRC